MRIPSIPQPATIDGSGTSRRLIGSYLGTSENLFSVTLDQSPVDFHCHSSASKGGNDPPGKIARFFAERGYAAFSITDHGDIRSIEPARRAANWLDIEFIPGVEINSRIVDSALQPPADATPSQRAHILAYDFEPTPELERLMEMERSRNREWIREGFERLQTKGVVDFDLDHLWGITHDLYGPDAQFKTPLDCPYPLGVALQDAGILSDGELPHRGSRRLLAEVYPKEELPPLPPANEVCGAIRDAGGISILAHPGKWLPSDPDDESRAWLEQWLLQRVDGLEIYHPKNNATLRKVMKNLVARQDRPFTGGSDCHNFGVDEANSDATIECLDSLRSYDPNDG